VPVLAVPAFALTWWLACYLVGRDPRRPALRRAAVALFAYALAVACRTLAQSADWLPLQTVGQVLVCVAALAWAGAAVGLLPDDLPERRQIDRGWAITSGLLLLMAPALPPLGRLVVLAPLAGATVLLWRFSDRVRPRLLPAPLAVAAALYAVALTAELTPIAAGPGMVTLAAIGVDLMVLGFLVAVADALDAGERLWPDLRRASVAAVAAATAFGGPAALTMLAAPGAPAVLALQFLLVAVAMTAVGMTGPVRRTLDRLAFVDDEKLRLDRVALLLVAEALPRRRERHRLIALSEDEFQRLTRRALAHYGDLGRLLRNPLIDLPAVERRLASRGKPYDQPLARAVELRAVLRESVARLKPPGLFGTTEDWQQYNALHYCGVLGLRPYARRPATAGLDRDARRALDWFRQHVPARSLRQWQAAGSREVAAELWRDLLSTDPRWLSRAATRGPDHLSFLQNG
jgi:hypothetical protein